MAGRKKEELTLTAAERAALQQWVEDETCEPRMAKRAKIILGLEQGLVWREISEQSHLAVVNCIKWGKRFRQDGLAGLKDRPRPGAPTRITEEQRQQVKTLVREGNNDGKHSWTVRALASEVGMSVGAVHKILHEDDAPAKPDSFLSPANILPVPQRNAFGLVGLFVNPPLNALALSVGPEPTAGGLPDPLAAEGNGRRPAPTDPDGASSLADALTSHGESREGEEAANGEPTSLLEFVKYVYRWFPHTQLAIVVDDHSPDHNPQAVEWVARRDRIALQFTPGRNAWLSHAETWVRVLAGAASSGQRDSADKVAQQVMAQVRKINEEGAGTFLWTLPAASRF